MKQSLCFRWKREPETEPGVRALSLPVGLPEDIHLGADSDDFSIGMGDVNLNPIPRVKND